MIRQPGAAAAGDAPVTGEFSSRKWPTGGWPRTRGSALLRLLSHGERHQASARRNREVLSALELVADRAGVNRRAGLKIPQRFPAGGVQRKKVALIRAA